MTRRSTWGSRILHSESYKNKSNVTLNSECWLEETRLNNHDIHTEILLTHQYNHFLNSKLHYYGN